MPEMLEVEYYRRLAERALGRPIASVKVPDPHVIRGLSGATALRRALVGRSFTAARRRGKLLLLDAGPLVTAAGDAAAGDADAADAGAGGPTLGVRFGMTGGLVVDDRQAIDRLLYSPERFGEQWVRFRLGFAGGGALLGPDAATVTLAQLRVALATRAHGEGSGPPLKARLLDQARLAGVGNLLADEILWRAGLSPWRPSGSLTDAELRRLHRHLRATVANLLERGGSHTGDLMVERRSGGHCPKDGTELVRATVGGRTTWWCPAHQG
jgi:formamidopyrimidine-DNA glycosylase